MTQPTPVYSWAVGSGSAPSWELATASNRSLKILLNDISTCSYTVSGDSADGAHITDLITDTWVSRNGVSLYRGRVTNTQDNIQESTYDLDVTCSDYLGRLDRRLILDGDRTYTNTEQTAIVTDLINYIQAKPNGSLGLGFDPNYPTTGVLRTQTFTNGTSIWQAIKALTAQDGGFDFTIDSNLLIHATYPSFGTYKGTTLAYGGNVTQAIGTTDHSQYFNVVLETGGLVTGATGANPTSVVTAPDILSRTEGRWETALSNPELTTSAAVSTAATYYFNRYGERVNTMWRLTLQPGAWLGPSMLWAGDIVTVSVHRGRRMVDQQFRVYELDINLDQNNVETVTTTVGTIIPTDRSVMTLLAKKLNYLAKQ